MNNKIASRSIQVFCSFDLGGDGKPLGFWVTTWKHYTDKSCKSHSYHNISMHTLGRIEALGDKLGWEVGLLNDFVSTSVKVRGWMDKQHEDPIDHMRKARHHMMRAQELVESHKHHVRVTIKDGTELCSEYDPDYVELEINDLDSGRCDICEDNQATLFCDNRCGNAYCEECTSYGETCGCEYGTLVYEDELHKEDK